MPAEVIEGYHLSPQQKRVWQLQRDGHACHAQCAALIEGPLDAEALRRALDGVVARHEILRTAFHSLPGMDAPLQVIGEEAAITLKRVDLSGLDRQDSLVEEEWRRQREQTFDYERAPSARFSLLTLSPQRHLLLTCLPSLCADLLTLRVLLREVGCLYGAECGGGASPPEPLQYVQFAEWQNRLLESEEAGDGRAFWRDPQPARPPVLPFEGDAAAAGRPPADEEADPPPVELKVDGRTARLLEEVAAEAGAPASAALLAAWQVFLWRLTGCAEVVVGCCFDGRKFEELCEALGLFAKYAPVHTRLDAGVPFVHVVVAVAERMKAATLWQEYFTSGENQDAGANAASHPVGFDFFDFDAQAVVARAAGATFSIYKLDARIDYFKLRLSFLRVGDALVAEFRYDPRLYRREDVERLAGQFAVLLRSAAEEAAAPVGRLNALSEAERQLVLYGWNDTRADAGEEVCVHELFEAQAARAPGATAVACRDDRLTFDELNRRANRVAHRLRERGVAPETLVALVLERSVEMLVGVLGVLKAGGAYVPFEAGHLPGRLALMLEEARPRVLLTRRRLLESLPDFTSEVVCLDSFEGEPAGEDEQNLGVRVSPENLAYVIHTSGSSGRSKGVMIQHRSVVNLAAALKFSVYGGERGALRVSLNAPLCFDASVKQLVQVLSGHAVHIIPEEARRDGGEMLRHLNRHRLNVLDCTPSHLRALLLGGLAQSPGALRKVLVGGEAIDAATWSQLVAGAAPDFYNVYGPTECTDITSVCDMRAEPSQPSIGRPISNAQTFILDERMRPLPIGAPGELHIGGAGLARGYLGRPGPTAEKFVPHPFAPEPGARLYKTGDLARHLPDGRIEFLGRLDQQVKVRGYRVEPGEVRAALMQHPAVGDAFVAALADGPGAGRLVGYVVPVGRARAAAGRPLYRLPNGMTVAYQNRNETDYLYEEIFEKRTYLRHSVSLRDGMCVFDVGANIGMFTLYVSRHCEGAKIYAFEPLAPIYDTLCANVRLHGAGAKLFQFGLSRADKSESFTYYPRYSMMSGVSAYARPGEEAEVVKQFLRNEERAGADSRTELLAHADALLRDRFVGESHQCRLRTLSALVREEGVERIDLLKIDVQRAELDVLLGVEDGDWEKIQQVVMEVHDAPGQESEGRLAVVRALLEGQGFSVVVEQDELLRGTDRYNLYATRGAQPPPANGDGREYTALRAGATRPTAPALTPEGLREHLRERVPDYMIPSAFVVLDELPLTPNGKVDREALPAPGAEESQARRKVEPPRTPEERILAETWSQVLGVAEVSIDDNFFELGGDSIRSIQAQALASKRGLSYSVQELFAHQTIRELVGQVRPAAAVARAGRGDGAFGLISREDRLRLPDDVEDAYPLAGLQAGMLFHSEYRGDGATYHNVTGLRVKAPFDFGKLEGATRRVLDRHPVLRTSFNLHDYDEPLQLVHRGVSVPLGTDDLRHLPGQEQERLIDSWMEAERCRRFDWACAPLLRLHAHRLGDEAFQFTCAEYHAILDGWSLSSLLAELFENYAALLRGANHCAAPLSLSFRDFVALEREALASEDCRRFWARKLQDLPRTAFTGSEGGGAARGPRQVRARRICIRRAISDGLEGLARSAGVTLKSALLAAHLRVLGLLSGQAEVVTGLVSNGRPEQDEGDKVLGLFINTLPFRMKMGGGTWAELARAVFDAERELLPFRHYPLAEMQRLAGGPPLIDTFFNYSHFHIWRSTRELQEVSFLGSKHVAVDVDFALTTDFEVDPLSKQVELSFSYDTARLSDEQVEAIGRYYESTLEAMALDPSGRYESHVPQAERERRRLHLESGVTRRDRPPTAFAHELFEAQTRRTPGAAAVSCGGVRLTYAELNSRANRLAHHLIDLDVEPESLVGVYVPRSVEMVVALLGILKAGAAYVPLDREHPRERLAFMLEDARPRALLTYGRLPGRLPLEGVRVVQLDDCPALSEKSCENPQGPRARAENLAYVIYTSGSTGRPKGVATEHGGVATMLAWAHETYTRAELSSVLASTPLCFDMSVFELLAPLTCGGELIVAESLLRLPELHEAGRVRMINATPSAMAELLGAGALPPAVRVVNFAGEPLPEKVARQTYEHGAVNKVWNLYGVTEDAVFSTGAVVERGCDAPPSIGRPLAHRRACLLDPSMRPVPAGLSGELYLGGPGLARGYFGRPDLTAERFVPDPFSSEPGARLYRTGDLARRLPDGQIEFLGRADEQVKVRGCRVELGEVEATLTKHPSVGACAVVLRQGRRAHLVAYVVAAGGGACAAELRRFLSVRLPQYMLPDRYVVLDRLPLTPNGKLDRRALPEPAEGAEAGGAFEPPRTPEEAQVASVWAEAFGLERVGAHDDFFELGGRSLLAMRVVSRLRHLFSVGLPLRVLFEARTVAGVAEWIAAARGGG